jgi:hypothetical protein
VLLVALFVGRVPVVVGCRGAVSSGRDVVDVDGVVALEIVHGVDPPAAALLDRAARAIVLLCVLFRASKSFRGSGWTEVGGAIPPAWCRWCAARGAEPRTAEPTAGATTWPRSAESSRPRSTESAPWRTRAVATRRPVLTSPGLAHGEAPTLEGLGVESLDDFFGGRPLGVLDEGKATGTPGLTIDGHYDVGGLGNCGEMGAEVGLTRAVWQVPDEQTD